jgi:serpin B
MPRIRTFALVVLLAAPAIGGDDDQDAAKRLVAGNTAFACDLYGHVRAEEGNLFLSPYSISTALAMTAEGAAGETLRQMDAVLHLPADRRGPAFEALAEAMTPQMVREGFGQNVTKVAAYDFTVANRLWGQKGFPFHTAFLDRLRDEFRAPLEAIDFRQTATARARINGWVEEKTNDRIKDLLPPGLPTADERLVLVNAVYFKSAWQHPFSPRATKDGPFHTLDGGVVTVPMLGKTHGFPYGEVDGVQVLELPYRAGQLSMVVLLPRAKDGLPALEKALAPETLSKWTAALGRGAKVAVTFPKFRFTKGFNLTKTLEEMGMRDAFHPRADFRRMTDEKPFFIGFVLHKGFVAVDEKGTEAAAATAVGMRLGAAPRPQPPIPFVADHPFLFLIRDRKTGTILFLGRVLDPSA